jgi:hypothetical protein
VSALLWPLLAWTAYAQSDTVVASTTGEGVSVAFLHSVVVDKPATVLADTKREGAVLASVRSVVVRSISHSAWAKTATAVEGTTGE